MKHCTKNQEIVQCASKDVRSLLICLDGSVEEGYGPGIQFNFEYTPSPEKLETLTELTEFENMLRIDKYKYNRMWRTYIKECRRYTYKKNKQQ